MLSMSACETDQGDQVKQCCLERKHAADGCGCPAVIPPNGLMSITASPSV